MTNKILPLILSVAILSSCSSVYKSSQTPDDVYYSPAKAINAREEDNTARRYEEATASSEDRYLRMKVRDRRWSSIDDFDYWNNSRSAGNYYNYLYVDSYSFKYRMYGDYGWAYYGNNNPYYPVYYPVPYKFSNIPSAPPARTSKSTILAYKNGNYNNSNNTNSYRPSTSSSKTGNNNLGSMLKRVFTATPANGSNSWDRPVRSFDNSSSSTSRSLSTTPTTTTTTTSSSAGGNSGGYNSTGSSSTSGRAGKN